MCVKEIGLSQSHSSGDPPSAVARLQPCKKTHSIISKIIKYFHKFYNININV